MSKSPFYKHCNVPLDYTTNYRKCNKKKLIDWLFMHLSPKFIHWNLRPSVMAWGGGAFGLIKSWGWIPHEWDQRLYKRDPREHSLSFNHVRTQRGNGCLWTRKWVLTRNWICCHFDLGLPSHPDWGGLLPQPRWTKTEAFLSCWWKETNCHQLC